MKRKFLIPTENQEQRALVNWLSYHPIVRDYFFKINNEAKRTPSQGFNLNLMGMRAGVSDLFIYYPTNSFNGLFLEIKRNKNYTKSEMSTKTWIAQEEFIANAKKVGFSAKFCYGWMDGMKIVESYLQT
jgi:hypothetical protein